MYSDQGYSSVFVNCLVNFALEWVLAAIKKRFSSTTRFFHVVFYGCDIQHKSALYAILFSVIAIRKANMADGTKGIDNVT